MKNLEDGVFYHKENSDLYFIKYNKIQNKAIENWKKHRKYVKRIKDVVFINKDSLSFFCELCGDRRFILNQKKI